MAYGESNGHVTDDVISQPIGHFLLVVLWNRSSLYLQPFSRYWALSALVSRLTTVTF